MNFRLTIHRKLFLSHVLVVLLVSGSIGVYLYSSAAASLLSSLQERLKFSAALISRTLDAQDIQHIRSAAEVADPVYIETLTHLRTLRRMNPDVSYLYIMRRDGELVTFVVDSDESDGQALPGQVYPQAPTHLMQGFLSISVDDDVVEDEWGGFLSGYAPIKNSFGEYLVGMDMRTDVIHEKYYGLRVSAAISLVAAIMLAFIFSRQLASRFVAPINLAIRGCTDIASGKLETRIAFQANDEWDSLITAVNDMAATLAASEATKQDAFEALNQSRKELEIRVAQRTADLKEVNDKLSHEIATRLVAQEALHEAATTDQLTRMGNRRFMFERLEHELNRAKRNRAPVTLLMADLDNFKTINDTFGHPAGDSILEETAIRMRGMLRSQDSAARWGGEEFIILLPDTTAEQAITVAEKLRRRIADTPFFNGGKPLHVTSSFGVAEFDGKMDAASFIAIADSALYEAKRKGRNRVEI